MNEVLTEVGVERPGLWPDGSTGGARHVGALPASVQEWFDLYLRRFPRTRPSGRRAIGALYELLRDDPADGFTVRDVAAQASVGLDTVARVVQHLRGLGLVSVAGGGWVAEPGGRPGHGERYRYVAHWPPLDS